MTVPRAYGVVAVIGVAVGQGVDSTKTTGVVSYRFPLRDAALDLCQKEKK